MKTSVFLAIMLFHSGFALASGSGSLEFAGAQKAQLVGGLSFAVEQTYESGIFQIQCSPQSCRVEIMNQRAQWDDYTYTGTMTDQQGISWNVTQMHHQLASKSRVKDLYKRLSKSLKTDDGWKTLEIKTTESELRIACSKDTPIGPQCVITTKKQSQHE